MYSVYVIENTPGKRYTGSTEDLKLRLAMHNDVSPEKAKFHKTTYKRGPWNLIFEKEFNTRKEALDFERFLKTGVGREYLEQVRRGGFDPMHAHR